MLHSVTLYLVNNGLKKTIVFVVQAMSKTFLVVFDVQLASLCILALYVLTAILGIVISLSVASKPSQAKKPEQPKKPEQATKPEQAKVPEQTNPLGWNPANPFNRPGGNTDPPQGYWDAKPYGECAWIPGTNCPSGQVFAGIAKDDCAPGDAKTLCANEWWENLAKGQEWHQPFCNAVFTFPCIRMNEGGVTVQSKQCPLTIDSTGKTVAHGTLAVCTS